MSHAAAAVRRSSREPVAAKVPEVTFLFWVLKLLTTAAGEAISDFLALHGYALAGVVEVMVFVVAVVIQFSTRRYIAAAYWFLALAIAIFGTGAADFMHLVVGIPYAGTTTIWALVLAAIFWLWYRSERTLSIHSIVTQRRELFYWATVYATFALGTALGDFTASVLHFGYLGSTVLFAIVIMIPAVAWSRFSLNSVLCFWFAYVVTRPLGASISDWLSKPHDISGLNYGDGPVAVVLLLLLAVLVIYTAAARYDIQQPAPVGGLPDSQPARTEGPATRY